MCESMASLFMIFFFFQAEDGIRDYKVTGVQTCALPICIPLQAQLGGGRRDAAAVQRGQRVVHGQRAGLAGLVLDGGHDRSEERRVGKECRSRWSPYH